MGKSTGLFCSSLLFGLGDVVFEIIRVKGGEFHLNGFKALYDNRDTLPFVLVCALSSYVPDAALELIMEDSRAAKQVTIWQEAAQEEIELVASWGPEVWRGLCGRGLAGGLSPRAIQDKVTHSCMVS